MNMNQIVPALSDIFNESLNIYEKRKIVFWIDKDQEFTEEIDKLSLDGVKVHTLTENNQFYTKFLLEEEDPTSPYVIYTSIELNGEENWLTDTMLYSKIFYAERLSFILSELNIDPSLRSIVKKYERFFRAAIRTRRFAAFGIEHFTEEKIELAIMSALCQVKTPDFETVLKKILLDTLNDAENKFLIEFEKNFDVDVFWKYVAHQYGYDREEKTLKSLFTHLTVTAFSHSVNEAYLSEIKEYIATRNQTNALVFIDHWMHHKTDFPKFDEYAHMVEEEIGLKLIINQIPVEEFKQAETFPYIDRAIIIYIANGLVTKLEDYEEYTKLIKLRRAKHYFEKYALIYEALYYAVKMHEFYKEHRTDMRQGRAIDLYDSYVNEYYLMDTYYRKFYVAFDQESNHELLKKLKTLVEGLYTNWFMGELSAHWSRALTTEMADQWSLPGVPSQHHFYSSIVSPMVRNGDRVFVIISDAMRYEIGVELAERLNAETTGMSDVRTMLGVVPSVTKLGMASLLPHRELDLTEDGKVTVDGQPTSGLGNRKKILESEVADSIAVHFQDILALNKAGRREMFRGKKLIYIYHDTIDAMGDKGSTEIYTFNAVETALNQLNDLVKMIRDDVSGTNIFITADHGFLYQRDALEESDKLAREQTDTVEVNRRYILSKENQELPGQIKVNLTTIVKNEQQLTAYVPNATIRYRMQGAGANFVHGGTSLQEIVVPLVSFKHKRAGQRGSQALQKTEIKLTNTTRKITNSIFHLSFFQTERVEDKVIPRTVVLYFSDSSGNILSNEETIIGDRSNTNPAERTFKLQFILKSMIYEPNETYYLYIKDMETGETLDQVPFTINLGIVSDFDF